MSVVLCYIEVGLDLTGVEANIMMMRMLLSTKRSLIVINDSGNVKKKKTGNDLRNCKTFAPFVCHSAFGALFFSRFV